MHSIIQFIWIIRDLFAHTILAFYSKFATSNSFAVVQHSRSHSSNDAPKRKERFRWIIISLLFSWAKSIEIRLGFSFLDLFLIYSRKYGLYYVYAQTSRFICGSDVNLKMRSICFVSAQNISRKQNRKIEFVARDINLGVCFFPNIEWP